MTATLPDRNLRPGGRWSTPGLPEELLDLAALERAVAHLAAGWVPKVHELGPKLAMGAAVEGAMERACGLRRHALALVERDETALTARPVVVAPLAALDGEEEGHVVRGLDGALAFLAARYAELATRLDPLYDARLARTVRDALMTLPEGVGPSGSGALVGALDAAWRGAGPERRPLDAPPWAPLDRVPMPARPRGRPRPEPGTYGQFRFATRRGAARIGGELNENVMAELAALELVCRCSYEHPDLPWATHLAMARHAADEARHAGIFRRLLEERGFDESRLPQHGANYEYAYQFPECEPGSKRELLWRLLMLCTVLEALAIDRVPVEIAVQDAVGHVDVARALDYISADELFHTENGLAVTRRLCAELGLDSMVERERVHGRFFARQRTFRTEYLARDPERAAWEIARAEGPDPDGLTFRSRTERELRRRASFTEEECAQVDRWGYNPLSDCSGEPWDPGAPYRKAPARLT
jgi:uncharacterized ferritin-like protein (DUF455 family)